MTASRKRDGPALAPVKACSSGNDGGTPGRSLCAEWERCDWRHVPHLDLVGPARRSRLARQRGSDWRIRGEVHELTGSDQGDCCGREAGLDSPGSWLVRSLTGTRQREDLGWRSASAVAEC